MNYLIELNFYNSFNFFFELTAKKYDEIELQDKYLKRSLFWLLIASRGGDTRAKILKVLIETPMNKNELSKKLSLNYRTIAHHLKVLQENKIVYEDDRYGGLVYIEDGIMDDIKKFLEYYGGEN